MIVTILVFTILNFLCLLAIWGSLNEGNQLKIKEMKIFTGSEKDPRDK